MLGMMNLYDREEAERKEMKEQVQVNDNRTRDSSYPPPRKHFS